MGQYVTDESGTEGGMERGLAQRYQKPGIVPSPTAPDVGKHFIRQRAHLNILSRSESRHDAYEVVVRPEQNSTRTLTGTECDTERSDERRRHRSCQSSACHTSLCQGHSVIDGR